MKRSQSGFNFELFIELIRNNPSIWDIRSEQYVDKNNREEAWRQVACQIQPTFQSIDAEEQNTIVKDLKKRWRNLKQNYSSQYSKTLGAVSKGQTFKFYDGMSFLTPIFANKVTSCTSSDLEDSDGATLLGDNEHPANLTLARDDINNQISDGSSRRKRSSDNPVTEDTSSKRGLRNSEKDEEEEDEDKQFMMFLSKYTRSIQGIYKLNMRSELLHVVSKYCNFCFHRPVPTPIRPNSINYQLGHMPQSINTRGVEPYFPTNQTNTSLPATTPSPSATDCAHGRPRV